MCCMRMKATKIAMRVKATNEGEGDEEQVGTQQRSFYLYITPSFS